MMEYPIKVSFAFSARRKLIAGMHTPAFVGQRPIDPSSMRASVVHDEAVTEFDRVDLSQWLGVRDRLCARLAGHSRGSVITVLLIGDMDVQVLLAAIKHNPISKKGMAQEYNKVNRIAKEANVTLMDDP